MTSLRHAIAYHRSQTWRYQDHAGIQRTPTEHAERHSTSVSFLWWIDHLWQRRQARARHLASSRTSGSVPSLICRVFGSACGEALRVARCESNFSIHAVNGQFLGIFQMGSHERAAYATIGYSTAYAQIVAAHNYFVVAGWGPWSCA